MDRERYDTYPAKDLRWRKYWRGVMGGLKLPSVKDAKRALCVRRKRETEIIERLLTFIDCIPVVMRLIKCCLGTSVWLSVQWGIKWT